MKRGAEHGADCLGRRPSHQAGGHAEPAVVVDPGHHFELGPVLELHTAHHVHLPQLHGALSFPPTELVPSLATSAELDETVTLEAPVDGRTRWGGHDAGLGEFVAEPPGSPSWVLASELADLGLCLRSDLVRAGGRAVGPVGQGGQTCLLVAGDPGMHALARDPQALCDLGDLPPVLHDGQDGLVPLLHDRQLHQHGPPPCLDRGPRQEDGEDGRCQASAGATVKDQPEPVSRISRNSVKHQVTPECPASPGTGHGLVPPAGIEPATRGLGNRCSIH